MWRECTMRWLCEQAKKMLLCPDYWLPWRNTRKPMNGLENGHSCSMWVPNIIDTNSGGRNLKYFLSNVGDFKSYYIEHERHFLTNLENSRYVKATGPLKIIDNSRIKFERNQFLINICKLCEDFPWLSNSFADEFQFIRKNQWYQRKHIIT